MPDRVPVPEAGPGRPTPPIALAGGDIVSRISATRVTLDDAFLGHLRSACSDVTLDPDELAEASRDWWPLAMTWALDAQVGGLGGAVARPSSISYGVATPFSSPWRIMILAPVMPAGLKMCCVR